VLHHQNNNAAAIMKNPRNFASVFFVAASYPGRLAPPSRKQPAASSGILREVGQLCRTLMTTANGRVGNQPPVRGFRNAWAICPPLSVAYSPDSYFNEIAAMPAATLIPLSPSTLTSCKEIDLVEPPINTLALPPTPAAAPAVTPP
jgi:hypothetical protein